MSFTKEIPPELQQRLNELNAAVDAAVKARTQFLDAHMEEVSQVKVGDPLYSVHGPFVGNVTELYRYWQNRDWRYDTSFSVECRYRNPDELANIIDNTSRQPGTLTWRTK